MSEHDTDEPTTLAGFVSEDRHETLTGMTYPTAEEHPSWKNAFFPSADDGLLQDLHAQLREQAATVADLAKTVAFLRAEVSILHERLERASDSYKVSIRVDEPWSVTKKPGK